MNQNTKTALVIFSLAVLVGLVYWFTHQPPQVIALEPTDEQVFSQAEELAEQAEEHAEKYKEAASANDGYPIPDAAAIEEAAVKQHELQPPEEVEPVVVVDVEAKCQEIESLQAQIKSLNDHLSVLNAIDAEITPYFQPRWTWPGSDQPDRLPRLRQHMASEERHQKWASKLPMLSDLRVMLLHDAQHVAQATGRLVTGKAEYAYIVMESGDGCLPCERWKQNLKPKFEALGWKVKVVRATSGFVPRWHVHIGPHKWFVPAGETLDEARMTSILNEYKAKQ